jgi:cell wall-associated NlpC family hydrolase
MGVQLPVYPVITAPAWCERYVGLPYAPGGRGPDEFDCWGVLMAVLQREAGLPVPSYEGITWRSDGNRAERARCADVIERERLSWAPVLAGQEREFDCVILRVCGRPLHVGVVVNPGLMLHADEDADSALERYDGMHWRNRVEGFCRFMGEA